jgi:hypothetical protein
MGLRLVKAAVPPDGCLKMPASTHQISQMRGTDADRYMAENVSPGILRPLRPRERLIRCYRSICVVRGAILEEPNAEQYEADRLVVADRGAQLPRPG